MSTNEPVEPVASSPSPSESVSATEPDWSREALVWGRWDPPRKLLRAIRRFQRWNGRRGPIAWAMRKWAVLQHRWWSIVCGCDVPVNCSIAGGLLMPHPVGIVIHPSATVGPNCLIFQQVTIGLGGPKPGMPRIGGHVDIGAGAKILGGVTIGNHAKIGANAVVLCDVPDGATAVGVPARVLGGRRNTASGTDPAAMES